MRSTKNNTNAPLSTDQIMSDCDVIIKLMVPQVEMVLIVAVIPQLVVLVVTVIVFGTKIAPRESTSGAETATLKLCWM